jgi:hypothetical protein
MSLVKGPLAVWLVPETLGIGAAGAIHGSIERVGAPADLGLTPLRQNAAALDEPLLPDTPPSGT